MVTPVEPQVIVDAIIALVGALFGWLFKMVWDAIKELQKDIKDTNQTIHESYVRKDDYRVEIAEIKGMFNRIMDKLDGKVDKQ
jgi:cell division protein FtsL